MPGPIKALFNGDILLPGAAGYFLRIPHGRIRRLAHIPVKLVTVDFLYKMEKFGMILSKIIVERKTI